MFIQNWIHGPTEVKQLGELGDKLERSRLEEMNLTTVVPHSLLSHSQHAHAQPPTSTYLLILTPPTHIPTSTFFCYLYPCSKDYPTSTILSSKCSYYHSLWSMHFSSKQALRGKLSQFFKTISITIIIVGIIKTREFQKISLIVIIIIMRAFSVIPITITIIIVVVLCSPGRVERDTTLLFP